MQIENKDKLVRVSMTVAESLLSEFDAMIETRSMVNRSQAMSELIHQEIIQHKENLGNEIMAGTINLVFDHSVPMLQSKLTELQYKYLNEVISCLNVNLSPPYTLSLYLVQGPGDTLKKIVNEMKANRGVITGKLQLSSAILPPVHPLPEP